jgi:hypothetical protein
MFTFIRQNFERQIIDAITSCKRRRTRMRKSLLSVALAVLIGAPAAFAQGGTSTVPKNSPSVGGMGGIPEAPIGHRQPRASDVPSEKNLSDPNNPAKKEDAALDRKIKSICRGC